ncbi:sigma-54-dependent transcriptional regulator [Deminuibacter soli]|uniref:Sigma-54-dependent Fis family transcriptional regulator n=1 Tax=Deminuibacter soli TaxID=2291815 RepID=A0A3E1NLC0_9BACT|nr:sigma-54 dependent transcriptional regulator [Deminuibacter soli]RFM28717.1 sigma-54-dependent Fis family transcriptional regulator [Deminuibacter soli]
MKNKILIVEDQFIEAHNLRMVLETAGYTVCSIARSVQEALKIIAAEQPGLVLLDIFLNGNKTGIELAILLKKQNIPFIYLSANSDKDTFALAKQTNPYGFLVKPFREKDVLAMLDIAANLHEEHVSLARMSASNTVATVQDKKVIHHFGMIGNSPVLKEIERYIGIAAAAISPVLILGESGTGKEVVARAIHENSARAKKPLVVVDCAALTPTLIESELFGHEKGSFTGAVDKRTGRFEQAAEGTIFLDEVGEMPVEIQSKLLRVLQEKEICPIGGTRRKIDVRIIAATNRNLEEEVAAGRFRLDLYYRLFVFPIQLMPLRDRKEDILPIAEHYLRVFATANNKGVTGFSERAKQTLLNYAWPGNVRELIHLVERSVLLCDGPLLIDTILLPASRQIRTNDTGQIKTITENERDHILEVLSKCDWKIYGRGGAADLLEINASTLKSRMKKLGISKRFD